MSNLILFDPAKARNGARVCLADGTPVRIVNFNLAGFPSYPILGIYKNHAGQDVYEVWPTSGSYEDEIGRKDPPQDLCLADDGELDRFDQAELERLRVDHRQTILKIKELNVALEAERREVERLKTWQKEALVSIKDWAKVEDLIIKTSKPRELGKEAPEVVLGRLATLADLEDMLKKIGS
jgi:hypothetical protein